MRASGKIALGAVVLAALAAAGGYGATVIMRNRVIAEVENTFAALRPAMAKAEHGSVEFDIWRRTLTIAAVNLVPKDAAADKGTTIGRITASGLNRDGGRVTADRLEIADFATTGTNLDFSNSTARYELPVVNAERVVFDPAKAGAFDGTFAGMRRALVATSAASIAAPTVKITSSTVIAAPAVPAAGKSAAPPAPTKLTMEQTQKDVRVEGLSAGRIAKGSAAGMTMKMRSAGPAGEIDAEIGELTMTGYDIGTVMSIADPQAAPEGMMPAWQSGTVGPIKMKIGQVATVTLAGMSAGSGGFDPGRLKKAMAVINAQQAAGTPPGRQTLQQQLALTNSAAEIYEAIEFGSFEYHGLQIDVTGIPPMKLAKLAIKDFKGGRIGDLEFQGIDGASLTGDKYLVGRFSLKGLKISDLIRLSGRMTPGYGNRQPQPNQMAGDMMKLLEAVEVEQLSIPDPKKTGILSIDSMKASWGGVVGAVPTFGEFSARAKPTAEMLAAEPLAMLGRAGLKDAPFEVKGRWKWDEGTGQFAIGPIEYGQARLGTMAAHLRFANVSRQAIAGGAAYLPVSGGEITLAGAEISARDDGAVKLMTTDPVAAPQHQQMLAALKAEPPTGGAEPEPAEVTAIKSALAKLLEAPGQRIEVKVTPKSKLTLMQLMAATGNGPQLAKLLTTEATTDVKVSPAR